MKTTLSDHSLLRGHAILGAALLCAATTSALAATLTVTKTADNGSGTFRAALAEHHPNIEELKTFQNLFPVLLL